MYEEHLARRILTYAAICGALGVAIGAIGAHFLPGFLESRGYPQDLIDKRSEQFGIGARYHMVHALALLGLSCVKLGQPIIRRWVSRMFLIGIAVFSGSLYLLAITGSKMFAMITPLGGIAWIVAWAGLAWIAQQGKVKEQRFHQIRGKTP
ncbi:hypothetical protein K227x_12800 [Rubripirellula lacrimiformis]|uniref:DUF423 domain-containing protein n=1 Tax=Rubripirellula lacrimiformis TaxID=1930273 RepID=A0A517N702_9BACT|nr:DUF423 domain-containing protein [Rubripirellula lacrimiformis]QDT02901.1 hypothetical protein K227x_12800 [Rubripirellula lacrimiformis]